MKQKINTLVFDVNETLLDLSPLKKSIDAALGDGVSEVWFAELLHYSLVESITGSYQDFSEIATAVLKMNAFKKKIDLTGERVSEILSPITRLQPYPDVKQSLKRLKNKGIKLVAFSNGKPSVLKDQMNHAGLSELFDLILSVEKTGKYKPHPETYEFAMQKVNSNAGNTLMVAAHGWDITGALRAGMQTAFIERPGKFLYPLAEKPRFIVENIEQLADVLLQESEE